MARQRGVGAALLLVLLACAPGPGAPAGPAGAPASAGSGPAGSPPGPLGPPASSVTPKSPYLDASGRADREKLRERFGEANQNLELNPRAVRLSGQAGSARIRASPDALSFPRGEEGVLSGLVPGDVLYCDTSCGGSGFIRIVKAIRPGPKATVVATRPGQLSDVIRSGWIHAAFPVNVQPVAGSHQLGRRRTPGGGGGSGGQAAQQGNHRLSGELSGSLGATVSFTVTVEVDLVVSRGYLDVPNGIDLFQFVISGSPSLSYGAQFSAQVTGAQDWDFFSVTIPLDGIDLPVLGNIGPTLTLNLGGHAEASGEVEVQATSTFTQTIRNGFVYTSQEGIRPVDGTSFSEQHDISITGTASERAYVQLEAILGVQLLGSGPYIKYQAQLGVEDQTTATVDALDGTCSAKVQADFLFNQTGSAGLSVNLLTWKLDKSVTFASHLSHYPTPPWSQTYSDLCPGQGCQSGQQECSGSCIDPTSDAEHCGSCEHDCTSGGAYPGASCDLLVCACPSGSEDCGSGCQDTDSDPNNCGTCGYDCTSGEAYPTAGCELGTCSCGSGSEDCGAGCQDTDSDAKNCGYCHHDCTGGDTYLGAYCDQGACVCPSGSEDCGSGCQDTDSDAKNCGGCAHDCTGSDTYPGASCDYGYCVCPSGSEDCGSGCQDTDSDPQNCGGCSHDCTGSDAFPDATCDYGSCTCPSGSEDCGAGCQDTDSDPNNCGGCNVVCDSGYSCSGGVCS